jgi:hypothetical protein
VGQLWTNNASSTLATTITDVGTSVEVAAGAGALFPNPGSGDYFLATLDDGTNVEIVRVTARTGDTFTVVRAQEGTTGFAFVAGALVELRATAGSEPFKTDTPGAASLRTLGTGSAQAAAGDHDHDAEYDPLGQGAAEVAAHESEFDHSLLHAAIHEHTAAGAGGPLTNDEHLGFSQYATIAEPTTPGAGLVRFYAADQEGITRLDYKTPQGQVIRLSRDNILVGKNKETGVGNTLVTGDVVYVSGASGSNEEVKKWIADGSIVTDLIGLVMQPSAFNGFTLVLTLGVLSGIDTDGIEAGTRLYASAETPGALTEDEPEHPNLRAEVGIVLRENQNNGEILVQPLLVRGDHTGTNKNAWKVGDGAAGAKEIQFVADGVGVLRMTPTDARVVVIPDADGTLSLDGHDHDADYDPLGAAAAVASDLSDHEADDENPHGVTAAQAGADAAGTAAAAVAAHAGASDPSLGAGSLVPMSQLATGTPDGTKFVRDDGTLQTPAGGGTPGGSDTQVQYNNAGAFGGLSNVVSDGGGRIKHASYEELVAISPPSAAGAGIARLFGFNLGSRIIPAAIGPSGGVAPMQSLIGCKKIALWHPNGNATTVSVFGVPTLTATGTATSAAVATTRFYTALRMIEYLVITPSDTAVAGWRHGSLQWMLGPSAGMGGFHFICRFGPATGVATATNRAFVGLQGGTSAPTDVEPSSIVNTLGVGWDAADDNIQFMHNDGSGTATKVDLGASFPVPTVDRTHVYELAMFCPPNGAVIGYRLVDLLTGAVASGTVSADIPANDQMLAPRGWMSVGGTSSVIGIALVNLYIETDA